MMINKLKTGSESDERFAWQLALFVDSELSSEEESLLLAWCERDPAKYRDLALALVERKRLQEAFAECPGWDALAEAFPLGKPQEQVEEKNAALGGQVLGQRFEQVWGSRWSWLGGLAASLLIGFGLGYGVLRDRMDEQLMSPIEIANLDHSTDKVDPLVGDRVFPDNPETLVRFIREMEQQSFLPDEVVRELDADGVQLEPRSSLFVFDLPDGRRVAVPAQITNVSNRSR